MIKKITLDDFMSGKINREKYIGKHLCFDPNTFELVSSAKDSSRAHMNALKKGVDSPTCIYIQS